MHAVLVPQRSLRCPVQKRACACAWACACVRVCVRACVCVCVRASPEAPSMQVSHSGLCATSSRVQSINPGEETCKQGQFARCTTEGGWASRAECVMARPGGWRHPSRIP
eukprot:5882752-Alexandrium_andersonii.AAC.1